MAPLNPLCGGQPRVMEGVSAGVAELVDATDLKSKLQKPT
jgi:hypothetical protein